MTAYLGSSKIGEVESSIWRAMPDGGIFGTLILSNDKDYSKSKLPETLTLVDIRDGITGTIKFLNFEVTVENLGFGMASLSFVAESVSEWKPIK